MFFILALLYLLNSYSTVKFFGDYCWDLFDGVSVLEILGSMHNILSEGLFVDLYERMWLSYLFMDNEVVNLMETEYRLLRLKTLERFDKMNLFYGSQPIILKILYYKKFSDLFAKNTEIIMYDYYVGKMDICFNSIRRLPDLFHLSKWSLLGHVVENKVFFLKYHFTTVGLILSVLLFFYCIYYLLFVVFMPFDRNLLKGYLFLVYFRFCLRNYMIKYRLIRVNRLHIRRFVRGLRFFSISRLVSITIFISLLYFKDREGLFFYSLNYLELDPSLGYWGGIFWGEYPFVSFLDGNLAVDWLADKLGVSWGIIDRILPIELWNLSDIIGDKGYIFRNKVIFLFKDICGYFFIPFWAYLLVLSLTDMILIGICHLWFLMYVYIIYNSKK